MRTRTNALAVLCSGGLDSAILLGEELGRRSAVFPLYVRSGLAYEPVELRYLRRYLGAVRGRGLRPLVILDMPAEDLYGNHWSIAGKGAPARGSADEHVFLPGRNVLLLTKAMLWCHLHQVPAVALGSLATNPFPDATPRFFSALEDVVNQSVQGSVRIELPFAGLTKTDVMQRGRGLPLELTFSCIQPRRGLHCGGCNKCGERQQAFADAAITDPTRYAYPPRKSRHR